MLLFCLLGAWVCWAAASAVPTAQTNAPPDEILTPTQALSKEYRRLAELESKMSLAHEPLPRPPEYIAQIRACREAVMAYTRAHSDAELDAEWDIAFSGIVWLSSYREWAGFEEADRMMREATALLAEATPADPDWVPRMLQQVMLLHEQVWYREAPVGCARWLDECAALVARESNSDLLRDWHFFAPNREINLMFSAAALSPEERNAFSQQREEHLREYLRDERIPLDWRTRNAWWWGVHLKSAGQAERAIALLDGWLRQYGDRAASPLLYELRLFLALYEEGDWETARAMMNLIRPMVAQGRVPKNDYSWVNMNNHYYGNMFRAGYEIKRQQHDGKASAGERRKDKT